VAAPGRRADRSGGFRDIEMSRQDVFPFGGKGKRKAKPGLILIVYGKRPR